MWKQCSAEKNHAGTGQQIRLVITLNVRMGKKWISVTFESCLTVDPMVSVVPSVWDFPKQTFSKVFTQNNKASSEWEFCGSKHLVDERG